MFYATGTLGKVSSPRSAFRATVFPQRRLLNGIELGELGRAAAVSKSAVFRAIRMRLKGMPLGDLGKPVARPAFRVTRRLGDVTCRIDPVTGGRVCSSDPVASTTAISPGYLGPPVPVSFPDGSLIQGSGPAVSQISGGVRRWIPDPDTFNSMGFNWSSIQKVSDAQYNAIPAGPAFPSINAQAATPAGVPATTSALPSTIQPTASPAALPTSFVSTAPAAMPISGGSSNLGTYLMWGGLGVAGLIVLKMTGVIGKK